MTQDFPNSMARRKFLALTGAGATALLAGALIHIEGCSESTTGSAAQPGDLTGTVDDNHAAPHRAIIKKAQLDAGGGITLDIQGSASHSHTVALTAVQIGDIKAGTAVAVQSSTTNSHSHLVHFN